MSAEQRPFSGERKQSGGVLGSGDCGLGRKCGVCGSGNGLRSVGGGLDGVGAGWKSNRVF